MNNYLSRLEEIKITLNQAKKAIEKGDFVSLTNIQENIKEICTLMKKDPPIDQEETIIKVSEVISDLDRIADSLKLQYDKNSDDTSNYLCKRYCSGAYAT